MNKQNLGSFIPKQKSSEKVKKIPKSKQEKLEQKYQIKSYEEYRIKDDSILTNWDEEDIESKLNRLIQVKKKGGNIKENLVLNRPKKRERRESISKSPRKKPLQYKDKDKHFENIPEKNEEKSDSEISNNADKKLEQETNENSSKTNDNSLNRNRSRSQHQKNTRKFQNKLVQQLIPAQNKICDGMKILINLFYSHKKKIFVDNFKFYDKMQLKTMCYYFEKLLRKYMNEHFMKRYFNILVTYYKIIKDTNDFDFRKSTKEFQRLKINGNNYLTVELKTKGKTNNKKSAYAVGSIAARQEIEKEKERMKQQLISENILSSEQRKLKDEEKNNKMNKLKQDLKPLNSSVPEENDDESNLFSDIKSQTEKDQIFDLIDNNKDSNEELEFSLDNNTSESINEMSIKKKRTFSDKDQKLNISNIFSDISSKRDTTKPKNNNNWLRKSLQNKNNFKFGKNLMKSNITSNTHKTKSDNKALRLSTRMTKMAALKSLFNTKTSNHIQNNIESVNDEEILEEDDEYFDDDSFINHNISYVKDDNNGNWKKFEVNKSQLVEYDLFYKEQFFKNDVFKYDVNDIVDKEVAEINKEMNKLEIKRKLIEKKKLKEVNSRKGLNTDDLEEQIKILTEKYNEYKKVEEPKIELVMNNTEGFFHKGRLLCCYFDTKKESLFPRFSLESAEETSGKEIIDFKPLRNEELIRRYFDYCICLEQRKKINKLLIYTRYICKIFVDNWIFDDLSLIIIVINTILFLISDPTDSNNIGNKTDIIFLVFYTLEAILKIITFSFINAEDSYLKDYWNILDFLIVVVGWISFIADQTANGKKISGLSGLRAFRILRPLKTVKRFRGLKKLVMALVASISHLGETVIVLVFFFLTFSVAGVQMWQGYFMKRCMNLNFGYFVSTNNDEYMCSDDLDCNILDENGNRFICAKAYINPNAGAVNFDNTIIGFMTVFVMATLEGWTTVFTYVEKTFSDSFINQILIFVYFHLFIFVGAFYLINLFLAVTNSEFEHIEMSRRKLVEKKSFYRLMKKKYDVKEKEKQERKEKERLLKLKNNKKSDESLKQLYYKVKQEAFHIGQNKRNIPVIYSTIKDMYIMSNNNPEELYKQKLRINEEERLLCKDIKRQQQELKKLILEKKKSMNKTKEKKLKNKNNLNDNLNTLNNQNNEDNYLNYFKKKFSRGDLMKNNATVDKNNIKGSSLSVLHNSTNLGSNSGEDKKNSSNNNLYATRKLYRVKTNVITAEILNLIKKIKVELIDISIDNTQKSFKDKVNSITKMVTKNKDKQEQKKKKMEKKELEKLNQISIFDDCSFEKEIKEQKKIDPSKVIDQIIYTRLAKNKKLSRRKYDPNLSTRNLNLLTKNETNKQQNTHVEDKSTLKEDLSFINDLSLSSLSANYDEKVNNINTKKTMKTKAKSKIKNKSKKKNFKRRMSFYSAKNNIMLTKIRSRGVSVLSYDTDMPSKILIEDSIKKTKSQKTILHSSSVIAEKKLMIDSDFNIKSRFGKPHAILNKFLVANENNLYEKKYEQKRKNFNINKYLETEDDEIKEKLNLDRRKSFLNFFEYLQKPSELEEAIYNDEEEEIEENNSSPNLSFLSQDSELKCLEQTINDKLLPQKISDIKTFKDDYITYDKVIKNINTNKLIQLIRNNFFDRESINTNINLTTKELSEFYKKRNEQLEEQLFIDNKKIRIRKEKSRSKMYKENENDLITKNELNISHVYPEKNYEKYLKAQEYDEEDEDEEKYLLDDEYENLRPSYKFSKELRDNNNRRRTFGIIDNLEFSKNLKEKRFTRKASEILLQNKFKSWRKSSDTSPQNNLLSNYNGISKEIMSKIEENVIKEEDRNSGMLLISNAKTEKLLNAKNSNDKSENNKSQIRHSCNYNDDKNKSNIKIITPFKKNTITSQKFFSNNFFKGRPSINEKDNKKKNYLYKAKSIIKNKLKYPVKNSNQYLVKEENKPYTDPLTVKQELIPDNLRGKKYYMNYLNNIQDKDLKVKDNFKVDHWVNEIIGTQNKFLKIKPLPKRAEAFFVFNDKKLKLLKYTFMYYKDPIFAPNELAHLTHNLTNFPISILEIMPLRLRNFGKYCVGKEINPGVISIKPTAMTPNNLYINNPKLEKYNARRGKNMSDCFKNKSTLINSSSFIDHHKVQDDLKFKKLVYDRIYKRMDDFNYLTLSHYFLEEQKLYYKFIDPKKKEEIIKNIAEKNREKKNRLEVKTEVQNIKLFDIKTNSHRYIQWSGEDVLEHSNIEKNKKKWNRLIRYLENFNLIIWHQNDYIKKIQKLRYAFYVLATNDIFDFIILSIVIANTICMSLDGNVFTPEINNKMNISNYIFNSIFIFEYIIKIVGLTPLVYFSDAFTYLDTLIIAFAIIDLATPNDNSYDTFIHKNTSSQLSFLRVFRIFRVVRVTKILRRLKSMRLIIVSIKKALTNVSYITCILIMFILIFTLLGLSLLNGNVHYQSFFEGFYSTYQVLTVENWNTLLYEIYPMNPFCFIYFVIWIFLGNYILFNLFISILLQSFGETEEDENDDLSEDEKVEKMHALPEYLISIKNSNNKQNDLLLTNKRKKLSKDEKSTLLTFTNTITVSKDAIKNSSSKIYTSPTSILNDNNSEDEENKSDELSNDENNNSNFTNNMRCYTGVLRRKYELKKVNKLFKKNECENSLFILSQTNSFRVFCMKLINNDWFEYFILLMILLSTIRLILDTFLSGYSFVLTFDIIDTTLNFIFLFEGMFKICALGFAFDEGSYLRDNWNKIDVVIILCSLFDFQNTFTKYISKYQKTSTNQFLKIIRLLRTLRPLRFISHNEQLKLIITSLFDSILPILSTLFIVVSVLLIFSIVGVTLFYNLYHNCYYLKDGGIFGLATSSFSQILKENNVNDDIIDISNYCVRHYNGIMDTGPAIKFTNIFTSMVASYILSTMEGWTDIMSSYRVYNDFYGIYFVIFNLFVPYFFMNIFTAIMFKYFNDAFQREKKISKDDKKASKYYDFLTQVPYADSHYVIWVRPMKGTFKYYLREFAESELLDNFMIVIILLNLLAMSMKYEGSSKYYTTCLSTFTSIFTVIFLLECILKIIAFGFKAYFHTTWNKYDFFVLVISLLDWVLFDIQGIQNKFLDSFQIIKILRVLKITRVLRLVKALKDLEKLLQTLTWSALALVSVLCFMLIWYCIFAILGCYFYDMIRYEKYKENFTFVNEYYNLDDFYKSFLLIFRCATGENWPNIMYEMAYVDQTEISEAYALVFFIVSNFISSTILLSLLLMVILQQYDEFTNKTYNPIEKFQSFLRDFNNAWNKFSSEEDEGFRIKKVLITQFFMELNWKKLNFPDKNKLEYIKKYVSELKLRTDDEDYVYYHNVIYKLLLSKMGSQIDRTSPDNILIFKTEKRVQEEIKKIINDYILKKSKQKSTSKQKQKVNLITYNPLTSHLYFKLSYLYVKTYVTYYKENCELLHHIEKEENYNFSSSEYNKKLDKENFENEENEEDEDFYSNRSSDLSNKKGSNNNTFDGTNIKIKKLSLSNSSGSNKQINDSSGSNEIDSNTKKELDTIKNELLGKVSENEEDKKS